MLVEVHAKSQCRTKWLWLVLYLCTCVLIRVQFSFSQFRFLNLTHSSGSCHFPLTQKPQFTLTKVNKSRTNFLTMSFSTIFYVISTGSQMSLYQQWAGGQGHYGPVSAHDWDIRDHTELDYISHTLSLGLGGRLGCVRWSRVERGWWVGAYGVVEVWTWVVLVGRVDCGKEAEQRWI